MLCFQCFTLAVNVQIDFTISKNIIKNERIIQNELTFIPLVRMSKLGLLSDPARNSGVLIAYL